MKKMKIRTSQLFTDELLKRNLINYVKTVCIGESMKTGLLLLMIVFERLNIFKYYDEKFRNKTLRGY